MMFPFLVLIVDTLHAGADGGQNLVGDGVEGIAEDGYRKVVAEDLNTIAFFTVNASDVDHCYVHADRYRRILPSYRFTKQ